MASDICICNNVYKSFGLLQREYEYSEYEAYNMEYNSTYDSTFAGKDEYHNLWIIIFVFF